MDDPNAFLAYEPTSSLDSESTQNQYRAFRDVSDRRGATFAVVTRDRKIAEKTGTIVCITGGRTDVDVRVWPPRR